MQWHRANGGDIPKGASSFKKEERLKVLENLLRKHLERPQGSGIVMGDGNKELCDSEMGAVDMTDDIDQSDYDSDED
jgi:hypothetical protein